MTTLRIAFVAALCCVLTLSPRAQKAAANPASTRSELHLTGLEQPVEVLRDRWGVSHIYAKNQHDLFFGQGYVAASDRLFQMELWKRTGQGRLAEILGPQAVQRDINARLLRYRGPLDAELRSYAPDAPEILRAFTSGINAYIDSLHGSWPREFQVAGFAPERWRPEDCLSRNAAYSMTSNAEDELYIAHLVSVVGREKAAQLLPLDPPVKLDDFAGADYRGLDASLISEIVSSDKRIEFPARESNNWTVSGALTATGRPMLANDPHRAIALPSLRYIVHLVAPGWDVIGSGEPALPGVAVGHNQNIGWGFTIFEIDQDDLFLEHLDPADPLRYRTASGWKQMEVVRETLHVKGSHDIQAELRFTEHGPVLWFDLASHRALAMRWVGAEPGAAGYLASLSLDRASNWQQFRQALHRWKLPPENFVYADSKGNIGEQSAGYAPVRTPSWTGLLPVPGDRNYHWHGWRSLDELPHSFNSSRGFVATANHRMIDEHDPHPVAYIWDPGFRFERISQFLSDKQHHSKITLADLGTLQSDVLSLPALEWKRMLQEAAAREPELQRDASVAKILGWDGRLTTDSAAAALYEFWERELNAVAIEREAPKELQNLVSKSWSPRQTISFFKQLPNDQRDRLLTETLKNSASDYDEQQQELGAPLTWGKLHTVLLRHPLEGVDGGRSWDLGPFARPGDGYTVNATEGEGFSQMYGASYRELFDTGNWDNSLAVNTPGQSGDPGSSHYRDLLPLWLDGKYFPLAYSREKVEKNAESTLELRPK